MPFGCVKLISLVIGMCVLSCVLAGFSASVIKTAPESELLLKDLMASSYFQDEVYDVNPKALKSRMKNWVNQLYDFTNQPICLSAQFRNKWGVAEMSMTECSTGSTLSDLTKKTTESGSASIIMGASNLGEIEWLTRSQFNYGVFFIVFGIILLSGICLGLLGWWLYYPRYQEKPEEGKLNVTDVFRSLYRVMGSNRRAMGLHDNWVYVKNIGSPNIEFINREGSKLTLRASLSDIKVIFPKAAHISRREMINTALGVHHIEDDQVVLRFKGEEMRLAIDRTFKGSDILKSDTTLVSID